MGYHVAVSKNMAVRIALAAIVLAVYGPSLRYGLIWDDPEWFARVAAARGAAAFGAIEGYGFFRPLTVLWHGAFVLPDGRVLDVPLHAAQILWHLGSTLMVHALAVRWLPSRAGAAVAALLFAVLPFAQQSVAWAGAHQPPALFFTLVALALWDARLEGQGGDHDRRRRALGLGSIAAYAIALGLHEAAAPLAIAIWAADIRPTRHTLPQWRARGLLGDLLAAARRPPPHLVLAVLFIAWRAVLPLSNTHVGGGMDMRSLGMLLQPVAWPLTRALALLTPMERVAREAAEASTAAMVVVIALAVWLALATAVARIGRPRVALWASLWIGLSIASPWLGLAWSYVRHGPRLGYTASVGVALLWGALAGGLLAAARARGRPRGTHAIESGEGMAAGEARRAVPTLAPRQAGVAIIVAALLALCAVDTLALNRMHSAAAAAVDHATFALLHGDALFINLPDRLLPHRPPYPLGDWDVIAMPVALEVGDFARARFGSEALFGSERSRFAPATGYDERAALSWWVDHRGEAATAEEIAALALDGRAVYSIAWMDGWPAARFVGRLLAPAGAELEATGAQWPPEGAILASGFEAGAGARAGSVYWPVEGETGDDGEGESGTSGDRDRNVGSDGGSRASAAAAGVIRLRSAALGGPSPFGHGVIRGMPTHLWVLMERRDAPPPPEVTAFVHLIDHDGSLAHTADGDAWGGLLPLEAWPEGVPLVDVRDLGLAAVGGAEIRIGLYERGGERLPALLDGPDGRRAPEDAVRIEFQGGAGNDEARGGGVRAGR